MNAAALRAPETTVKMPELQIKHIDSHVHFRGRDDFRKYTVKQGMKVAREQGVCAVCDMPNKTPPTLWRRDAEAVEQEAAGAEGYYFFMGAAKDPAQLAEAVAVYNENPRVVGLKLYAGKSTGNLAVLTVDDQRAVFRELVKLGYEGTVVVHCEKAALEQPTLWNPLEPRTWNLAKPPEAEIEAIKDILEIVRETGFNGRVHIAHVSTPEGAKIVEDAAHEGVNVSYEMTPHHLTYNTDMMLTKEDVWLKVNPPIRDRVMSDGLWEHFLADDPQVLKTLGTDHAPHYAADKTYDEQKPAGDYASGIRSLDRYAEFLGIARGRGMTPAREEALCYSNVKRVFPKIKE